MARSLGLRGHVDAAEHAADFARYLLAQFGVQIARRGRMSSVVLAATAG